MTSTGTAGSENFQSTEQQKDSESQPKKMSVTNGPGSPEVMDTTAQKDTKKQEELVKKFDNINYVEAPLPKTNPWNKRQNITSNPVSDPGMVVSFYIFSGVVYDHYLQGLWDSALSKLGT